MRTDQTAKAADARRACGERLRAERDRLGYAPVAFAALAGLSLPSQLAYEAGRRSPDADYLRAIATAGADVTYIVTGLRSLDSSSADQISLRWINEVEDAWRLKAPKPSFWSDQEVRRALISWHRSVTLDQVRTIIAGQFGPNRVPGRSTVHRFWLALDHFWRERP